MKLLVQRDEQIQIGAEIFMTPLYGCSEDAEFGMPIKYVFKREKRCCHAHYAELLFCIFTQKP